MAILQDSNGNSSSIRAIMVVCALAGCAVAIIGVVGAIRPGATISLLELSALVTGLIGAPVAGKVFQKGKE